VGAEAERLYREAREMLNTIIKDRLLTATGIVGFYPANSIGQTYLLVKDGPYCTAFLLKIQISQLES
jgi:5-methyltetrahydrofolate--homocysteine methyltransferase